MSVDCLLAHASLLFVFYKARFADILRTHQVVQLEGSFFHSFSFSKAVQIEVMANSFLNWNHLLRQGEHGSAVNYSKRLLHIRSA